MGPRQEGSGPMRLCPSHRACAWHELAGASPSCPGQSKAEEFSTLVCELAHEMATL